MYHFYAIKDVEVTPTGSPLAPLLFSCHALVNLITIISIIIIIISVTTDFINLVRNLDFSLCLSS